MNDLNMVIEELCEKFNCTLNELIPAYAHYKIVCCTIALVIFISILVACILWLRAYMHEKYLIKDEYFYEINAWLSIIGIIISVVTILVLIFDLIMWITMPQMQFLNMICG